MADEAKVIGKPLDRVDGRLKVTGKARYAAEHHLPNLTHGVLVGSTIARGRITAIATAAAEKAPGVIAVLTHRNAPELPEWKEVPGTPNPEVGKPLQPLRDDVIHHNGQPVALVVADTFERATQAAALVRVTYREERGVTEFAAAKPFVPHETEAKKPKKPADDKRGDPEKALADAAVKVEATYTQPAETHNPMEPHATVATWDGPNLTLYDKTQGVDVVVQQASQALGIPKENVRVIAPFVGGAFGSGLRAWAHVFLAAAAARAVKRPVKLVLTRPQMFTIPGYRPLTVQKITLGATKDGKLTAIRHEATGQTSTYEEYTETVLDPTRQMYACPNVETHYRIAAMNVNSPTPMRGPGEATGLYALECALDELAVALKMDPVELRLKNHADTDPQSGKPWSSKSLKECYKQAAEKFGWAKRDPKPRSMRDGRQLIGYGMATASWPVHRRPASARVTIGPDGTATVRTGSADIGPGTYTVLTQIAAEVLGLPADKVRTELADSKLPKAPVQGGSMTVASVGSAVHDAALAARNEVLKLAAGDEGSPLKGAEADQVAARDGRLVLKSDATRGESYAEVLKRHRKDAIEATRESKQGPEGEKFTMRAFGAQFVEVRVDADLGTIRIARFVSAIAAGRIVNPKTARSQAVGGIVGGLGMGLLEETIWDPRNARIVNANLADYHVPVHADVPPIDVIFVEEKDEHVNPVGAKGIAELTLVGVAPAVVNAVYHATGRRVRDLPITPDKLL
jgi:xanthine dehydrogenase YagR molybdenum-binding subunit